MQLSVAYCFYDSASAIQVEPALMWEVGLKGSDFSGMKNCCELLPDCSFILSLCVFLRYVKKKKTELQNTLDPEFFKSWLLIWLLSLQLMFLI